LNDPAHRPQKTAATPRRRDAATPRRGIGGISTSTRHATRFDAAPATSVPSCTWPPAERNRADETSSITPLSDTGEALGIGPNACPVRVRSPGQERLAQVGRAHRPGSLTVASSRAADVLPISACARPTTEVQRRRPHHGNQQRPADRRWSFMPRQAPWLCWRAPVRRLPASREDVIRGMQKRPCVRAAGGIRDACPPTSARSTPISTPRRPVGGGSRTSRRSGQAAGQPHRWAQRRHSAPDRGRRGARDRARRQKPAPWLEARRWGRCRGPSSAQGRRGSERREAVARRARRIPRRGQLGEHLAAHGGGVGVAKR
jgi:hypothetical protein